MPDTQLNFCRGVSVLLLCMALVAFASAATAATYLYNDNAPYYWESATTDVVWERGSTRYPVDDDKQVVNIGFSFPFAGASYSQVRILSNGILQFGADQGLHTDYRNAALPFTGGDRALYVYWDDLNPARGGSVRYSMHGSAPHRYFVVSWENLPNYNYTGVYNTQAILYEDGEIKFQYGNGNATGDSATIGVQVDRSDVTQYSFDTPGAVNGDKAIVFYRQRPHFSLSVQSTAYLCSSNAVNVTVTRHNADHSIDTSYTGSVTLSASSTSGTWANVSGLGTLLDLGGGLGQYSFSAADGGQAVLQFGYTSPVVTNFHVNDGSRTEHHAEDPYLTFRYGVSDNAADGFGSGNYVGSDGSLSWSSDWREINESDGAGAGDIAIVSDGGSSVLRLKDNDGRGEGVYREVDLSGHPSGTRVVLSLNYRRAGLDDANDYVAVAVSGNGGGSWFELGRFTGPGSDGSYQPATYDISGYAGANTQIRFLTSRWLGNNDYVFIDNVDISISTPTCGGSHYGISHGGIGVTCEASPVVVAAHDNAHAAAEPGAGSQVTLTAVDTLSGATATDAVWSYRGSGVFSVLGGGRARYTFASGETGVQLWLSRPAGGVVNIDVVDTNGANELSTEDPDLEFRSSALLIYADAVAGAVGSQIAGKSSASSPGAQTLTVRAVETDTLTGACQSRLSGPQSVEFAYECVNPSSCVAGQTLNIGGVPIPGHAAGAVSSYRAVTLGFDPGGYAPFDFSYSDAGMLVLHARVDLPASAEHAAATISGASNAFVVAPAGLCVEPVSGSGSCASGDDSCSIFVRAGRTFDLNVRAVAWQGSGESNADFCVGNPTTPNFSSSGIILTPSLVAPDPGRVGTLATGSVSLSAADAGSGVDAQAYSEVGVFRVEANPPSYLGAVLAPSTSANIGRVVPDRFVLSSSSLIPGCGGFTYMGQAALGISYSVEARNASSALTENYSGSFAKASVALVAENSDDGVTLASRLFGPSGSWADGLYAVSSGNAVFSRAAAADGPFDSLQLGVAVQDNDGANTLMPGLDMNAASSGDCSATSSCDARSIGATSVRFGRLNAHNAHGSELQDLQLPLRVEYFQGASLGFGLSTTDSCSVVNSLTISEVDAADGLLPAETCVWDSLNLSGVGCALPGVPALQFSNTPTGGLFNLNLMPPGAGNTGVVTVSAEAPAWLDYDWSGSGDSDPVSRATFGIFNRGGGIIYRREVR